MKPWTKKQTVIAIAAALLVIGVQALTQLTKEDSMQPNVVTTGRTDSSGMDGGSSDSSNSGSSAEGFGFGQADSSGADANSPASSGAFGSAGQGLAGAANADGSSDATSDGIIQRYNDAQQSEDRVFQGIDNTIKGEVTLQNPDTGEVTQGQAGSSNYYQSPSVDNAMGGSTIIGTDGGAGAPADSTQLNVVGSEPPPAPASSDAGATP